MGAQPIHLEIYPDSAGEYRWRLLRSGKILADSAEGYTRRASARRAARHLLGGLLQVGVRIDELD